MNHLSQPPLPEMPCLTVQRWSLAEWHSAQRSPDRACASNHPLGALSYGLPSAGANPVPANEQVTVVASQLLLDGDPQLDLWCASGPIEAGRSGQVRWWRNSHWVFGTVDLAERCPGGDLFDISQQAYLDIFQALAESARPHLLRVWNYLPQINIEADGMERYRQFNAGRQQAFLAAQRPAFEGAPAACALGTSAGPLSIRFLAGRRPPVALENPRQVSAYRYPAAYGPSAPTFSRAALVDLGCDQLGLLISGTASIVGHSTVHCGDVLAQTHEILRNLQAVIDNAHTRCSASFALAKMSCVVYLRRPADAPQVRALLSQQVGATSHFVSKAVFLQADICRSDLLMEIEAHGVAVGAMHS